jgi:tetratricopeptide (TPR) repeat protein
MLVLTRFISTEEGYPNVAIIYTYILLFVFSLIEFAGNITVTDSLQVITEIEGEDEKTLRQKRFVLLYGTHFWIWISVTGLICAGLLYLPFSSSFLSENIFFIICQFLAVVIGAGLFLFFYYRLLQFSEIKNPLLLSKAADYYSVSDLRGKSIELLEHYIEKDADNIGILSKISVLYAQENNHEKVLQYTGRVLAVVEEEKLDVPHTAAKAHLLRAVSLKAKEEFHEAYEEVTTSLRFAPESNAARKLRRDLRKIIKAKKQE